MSPSIFQFTNPVMLKFYMEINRQFAPSTSITVDASVHVRVSRHSEEREAIVEITVEIGGRDPSLPFYITATEGAKFRWEEEADNKADILLHQNAPALLLGYVRPIVASVTAASPFATYNIPFMDFTKEDDTQSDAE